MKGREGCAEGGGRGREGCASVLKVGEGQGGMRKCAEGGGGRMRDANLGMCMHVGLVEEGEADDAEDVECRDG